MSGLSPDELRAKAWELLCALDDVDLSGRAGLAARRLVRLTYAVGLPGIFLERQEDLGRLIDVSKTHLGQVISELRDAKILLVHPDRPLYELLPDVASWQRRPRCRHGLDYARRLEADLVRRHHEITGQADLAELDASFERPATLADGIGEASRDEAFPGAAPGSSAAAAPNNFTRPPGPGAADGRHHTHPPGNSRPRDAAGQPPSLSELCRRSLAGAAYQVPKKGTHPGASRVQEAPPVPKKGTCPPSEGGESGRAVPKKGTPDVGRFPKREPASRARPSDDHPDHLDHHPLSPQSQQLSSGSESDDQRGDEGPADDRAGGEEWKRRLVPLDDELFGDLRRLMGEDLGSFSGEWRRAIRLAPGCVAVALEAVKNNEGSIRKHRGGYLCRCFLTECRRRRIELPPDLFRRARERMVAR